MTASQSMQESRSRVGIPRNVLKRPVLDAQELRSRCDCSHNLFGNRAIARNFLAMYAELTLQQPACSTWPTGPALPTLPLL
eukprot:5893065-Pyramimonas_sp.AAC.1